jgi:hypothetical protein
MAWTVVPCLDELRDQLNYSFPNRDKTSDGSIGDYAHSQGSSSHNPDDTSHDNAEWDGDSDTKQEVRARDFDKDLGHPDVSMEDVVQHLVKYCRSGTFWWIRYIIYNGRIWSSTYDFATRTYTGSNNHAHHAHVNSQFNQSSDNETGCDYRLEEIVLSDADIEKIANKVWAKVLTNPYNSQNITTADLLRYAPSRAGVAAAVQGIKEIDPAISIENGYTQEQVDAEAANPSYRIYGALRMMNVRDQEKHEVVAEQLEVMDGKLDEIKSDVDALAPTE